MNPRSKGIFRSLLPFLAFAFLSFSVSAKEAPQWTKKCPSDSEMVYGVGYAKYGYRSNSRKSADVRARGEVAGKIFSAVMTACPVSSDGSDQRIMELISGRFPVPIASLETYDAPDGSAYVLAGSYKEDLVKCYVRVLNSEIEYWKRKKEEAAETYDGLCAAIDDSIVHGDPMTEEELIDLRKYAKGEYAKAVAKCDSNIAILDDESNVDSFVRVMNRF